MVLQLLISKLMRAASGTVCLNRFYSKVYDGCLTHNKNNSDKTDHDLQLGRFKNNEAFHFMASHAHICLDFKE